MKKNKIEENDIRKTLKTGKNKKQINFKRKIKKFSIFILIVLVIIGIIYIIKNRRLNIKQEQVTEHNYFILSENGKTGVIDKAGKVIIKTEYDYIQIPNPGKPIFICLYNYNSSKQEYSSKVLNEKGETLLANYTNVTGIPNNNTSLNSAYQTNILKYKKNEKYGLITITGTKITDAIYDSIDTFENKDEILKVSNNEKYGLIKLNGEQILNLEYYSISADGYYNTENKYDYAGFVVSIKTDEGYKYGYFDYNAKKILDCDYSSIKRITSIKNDKTQYIITYKNGQAGFYKNSQSILKNEYDSIEYDDVNKLLSLEKVGKYGVYDLYGNMILPIQYGNLIFAGTLITAEKDGSKLAFDPNGNIQKQCKYSSIFPTKSSDYYITIDLNGNYGIMDKNKNVLVDNKYSYIEYAFDEYFIITKDAKAGLIDYNDRNVIPNNYNIIQNINGTNILQAIDSENNITTIFNKKIDKIIETKDAHIYVKNQYIKVVSDDTLRYLDFDGNEKDVQTLFPNNNIFAKESNGKWGYVNKEGTVVVDYIYDKTTDINEFGFGAIKLNGKWGVVNSNGQVIKEPTYILKDIEATFIGNYYKSSADYEIDSYSNVEEIK